MKKLLAFILAAAMIFAFASCGKDDPEDTTGKDPSQTTADTKAPEDTTGGKEPEVPEASGALDVLNKIWDSFDDEEKFAVIGGMNSEGNIVDGAPGSFSVENAELLDSTLGFPQASASQIESAASLIFMMNANSFTAGAYQFKNSSDIETLASAIKDNIMNRQWMCGFPDKLIVISAGDSIVSAFGNEDFIELFKTKTLAALDGAKLLYEEPIL